LRLCCYLSRREGGKSGADYSATENGKEMKKIQMPTIRDLQKALTCVKREIQDDYIQDDDDAPSIQVTLACSETGYALQTGDNAYSGCAYGHDKWGVGSVYRCSDCTELAKELIDQIRELIY